MTNTEKGQNLQTVGWYEMEAKTAHLYLFKKPSFIKRFCMAHLLGFTWVDLTVDNYVSVDPYVKAV